MRPSIDGALLNLAGQGTLVLTGEGTGPIGTRFQLERWCVETPINGLNPGGRLTGWISRQAAAVESAHFAAVIQGNGYSDEHVDLELSLGNAKTTPLGKEEAPRLKFAVTPTILAGHVPILGASMSELRFRKGSVRFVFGPEAPDEGDNGCEPDALFFVGRGQTLFLTRLDYADLRVKRTTDLFDLTYGFRHYSLQVADGVPRIRRHEYSRPVQANLATCAATSTPHHVKPLLIVNFQPQYIFEEAFAPPDGVIDGSCPAPPNRTSLDHTCAPSPTRTRLSGRSRIVFFDKSKINPSGELLKVEYLTDWSGLATIVNKRALPRAASLTDQLNIVGITTNTSRTDAKKAIIYNTTAPSGEETAIEPVYRMLLSPDRSAQWRTTCKPPNPRAPVMWAADLANASTTAVRVLWSRDMTLNFIANNEIPPPGGPQFSNQPSFVGSLNCDDRRQLTEMMSVYGVAALRRLNVDPQTNAVSDDPNGMVFLPTDGTYVALDGTVRPSTVNPLITAKQEGFVLGRPFDNTFNLRLSRASTITARWIGEPPAPWNNPNRDPNDPQNPYPPFFDPAFTVEKYFHDTQDGRDTYVEVDYKGFLFPIGHRAALLKVSRREFWPEKNTAHGQPIAYLVQHSYIAVRNPDKTFPAYAQPFNSLDYSPHKVTIKTLRTPDLADPGPIPELASKYIGTVFWPQLLECPPGGGRPLDVLFEYTLDDGTTLQSPLLFVDNAAVHDPASMQNVVQYYMALPRADLLKISFDPQNPYPNPNDKCYLRFARAFDSPVRYAAENASGECTFKTAAWVLGSRGWLSTTPDTGVAVTKAENNGAGLVRLTLSSMKARLTDLTQPGQVTVYGITGTTEANGTWSFRPVTPATKLQIDLTTVQFQHAYVSGGYASSSIVLVKTAAKGPNGEILLTLSALKCGQTDLTASTKVYISGVLGTIEANAAWDFTIVNAASAQISLTNSQFQNPYISGGIAATVGVEAQAFGMDAFMEGRDQPPFYPIMTKARITVDKVDHLTGKPNTAIEVAFDPNYVRHGFDPATNPSEIFHDVLQPDIQFDPTTNTSSTGGVATTNSLLVALARKSGLIGGRKATGPPTSDPCDDRKDGYPCGREANAPENAEQLCDPTPARSPPLVPAALSAPTPVSAPPPAAPLGPSLSPYDLASAQAGRFDPVEFFGAALKGAKLFGIVPLQDIIRAALIAAAPKLMEATDYAAGEAADDICQLLNTLLPSAKAGAGSVAAAISDAETVANKALKQTGGSSVTLATLYPDFAAALDQLQTTATNISALPTTCTSENVETTLRLVGEFKSDVDAVLGQLQKLAQDPMPTVVKQLLQKLNDAWTVLQKLDTDPSKVINALVGTFLGPSQVTTFICDPLINNATGAELFELIFGYLDDAATTYTAFPAPTPHTPPTKDELQLRCVQIMQNPADVLPRLQQALFYEAFAQPFAEMLAAVQQIQQQITSTVNWARGVLADQITTALQLGYAAAQVQGFPKIGLEILADMQRAVPPIAVGSSLDRIGSQLDQAARASVQNRLSELRQNLGTWCKNAKRDADSAKAAVDSAAANPISAAMEADYQQKMTAWAAAEKRYLAFAALVKIYGDVNFKPGNKPFEDLIKTIVTFAQNQITSIANDLAAQLREQAKAAAGSLASRLFAIIESLIDTMTQSAIAATIAKVGKDFTDVCGGAAIPAYQFVQTLAVGLVQETSTITTTAATIAAQLDNITQQLNSLQIPADAPQDARNVILGLRAALTRSLQQLVGVILEFEKVRLLLPDAVAVKNAQDNGSSSHLIRLTLNAKPGYFDLGKLSRIAVDGVIGTVEANGSWEFSLVSASPLQIDLVGSQFHNTYVSGGVVTGTAKDAQYACQLPADFCGNPLAYYCTQPGQLLDRVARTVDLRRRAAQAVVDSLTEISEAIPALGELGTGNSSPLPASAPLLRSLASGAPDLTGSLTDLANTLGTLVQQVTVTGSLIGGGSAAWKDLRQQIEQEYVTSAALSAEGKAAVASAVSDFDNFKSMLPPNPKPGDILDFAKNILQFTALSDRKLAGVLLQAAPPMAGVWNTLLSPLASAASTIVDLLTTINTTVGGAVQTVLDVLDPSASGMTNIVNHSIVDAINATQAQIQTDGAYLEALHDALNPATPPIDPAAITTAAKPLMDSWQQKKPGVVQAVQVVKTVIDAVATGHFVTLFDIADFQQKLQEAVADLVPGPYPPQLRLRHRAQRLSRRRSDLRDGPRLRRHGRPCDREQRSGLKCTSFGESSHRPARRLRDRPHPAIPAALIG
jgi:hypothetical protein